MSRQLTVRGVSDEVAERLEALSHARGQSVNATVNQILEDALGFQARMRFLRSMPRWSREEADDVDKAIATQRTVDASDWR